MATSSILEIIIKAVKQGNGLEQTAADLTKVQGAGKAAGAGMQDLTRSLLGQAAGYLTVAGAVGGFIALGKAAINAAAEEERTMVRLNATLIATGRASEVSADQIGEMAGQLMELSTFDDEAIVDAYNTLMKFDSLPTASMDAVVKSAMNMSAALGGDLASNAEMIGRVLETGVIPRSWAFDKALKAQIQSMIAAGDSGGALSKILGELNTRYGGQAAAQLETYSGKVAQLKNSWESFLEVAGGGGLEEGKGIIAWSNSIVKAATDNMLAEQLFRQARALGIDVGKAYFTGQAKINGVLVSQEDLSRAVSQALFEQGLVEKGLTVITDDLNASLGGFIQYAEAIGPGLNDASAAADEMADSFWNGGKALDDYGDVYKTAQGFIDTYAKGAQSVADAEKNLADVRAANPWDKKGIEEATMALWEAQAAIEDFSGVEQAQALITQQIADARKLGYSETGATITGLKGQLEELVTTEDKLRTAAEQRNAVWMLGVLQQQLAADGLSSAEMAYLLQYQVDTGLITEEDKLRSQSKYDSMQADVATVQQAIAAQQAAFNSLTGRTVDVIINYIQHGSAYLPPAVTGPGNTQEYAAGGSASGLFIAGDPGPNAEAIYAPAGAYVYPHNSPVTQRALAHSVPAYEGGGTFAGAWASSAPVNVYITYAPTMSLGDEYEVQNKLIPLIRKGVEDLARGRY